MKSGRVFVGGLSSYGQLAMYLTKQCSLNFITRVFELVTTLEKHDIVDIVCGAEHSCFLTDTGRVFLSGYNYHQEIDDSGDNYYFPLEVDMDNVFGSANLHERIVKIYAGSWHTCLLTEEGNLYVRGAYSEYITQSNSNLHYVKINEDKKIESVCAGEYFTLLMDSTKTLWIYQNRSLEKIEFSSEIRSFDARAQYYAILGKNNQLKVFYRGNIKTINGTLERDDVEMGTDNSGNIDKIALGASTVATVYRDGSVRFHMILNSTPSNCPSFQLSKWIKDVSKVRTRRGSRDLVCVAGYQHFMFFWTSTESSDMQYFIGNLTKSKNEGTFVDLDVIFTME